LSLAWANIFRDMKIKLTFIMIALLWLGQLSGQHMNGVCVVGSFEGNRSTAIKEIKDLNANWISLSPEAKLDGQTLGLITEVENLLWSSDLTGYKKIIAKAKALDQKILLKPHVVVDKEEAGQGKLDPQVTWRGDIKPKSYWDWKIFGEAYRSYIIDLATFAEAEEVDMLCVGTELKSFVNAKPKFWTKLIAEVRTIYSGQLIYSANWDNYAKIPFWESLDYIGVNNYFPISEHAIPSVKELRDNWLPIKNSLQKYCEKKNKKMIITEFGYRNVKFSGERPWTHVKEKVAEISDDAQYNLLYAYFQSLWKEEWLAGGFLWNWNYNPLPEGNTDFSVQNKPALELVKEFFEETL